MGHSDQFPPVTDLDPSLYHPYPYLTLKEILHTSQKYVNIKMHGGQHFWGDSCTIGSLGPTFGNLSR